MRAKHVADLTHSRVVHRAAVDVDETSKTSASALCESTAEATVRSVALNAFVDCAVSGVAAAMAPRWRCTQQGVKWA